MAPKAAPGAKGGAPEKKVRTKRPKSNIALASQALDLAERRKLRQEAVRWCRAGNGQRGESSCKDRCTGLFPGVTRNMIQSALKNLDTTVIRDHHNQILTNDERKLLATWLLKSVLIGSLGPVHR